MPRIFQIIVACLLTLSWPAHAADFNCPEPTMQVAPNIVADGQARTMSIVNATDPDLKGAVQNTIVNLWAAYPQADRIAVAQNLLSTSCNLIKSSNLADERKLDRWTKLIELLLPSVPLEQRSYLELPPNVLSTIRLKDTSMEFARSILGVPRSDVDGVAKFEKSGYLITIGYLMADNKNLAPKGMIHAISAQLDRPSGKIPGTIIFDGEWNRFYGASFNPPLINVSAVLGSSTLKEFVGVKRCLSLASGPKVPLGSRAFFCMTGHGANNPSIRLDLASTYPDPAEELFDSLKRHSAQWPSVYSHPDLEDKWSVEHNRLRQELENELDSRAVVRFEVFARAMASQDREKSNQGFPLPGERDPLPGEEVH